MGGRANGTHKFFEFDRGINAFSLIMTSKCRSPKKGHLTNLRYELIKLVVITYRPPKIRSSNKYTTFIASQPKENFPPGHAGNFGLHFLVYILEHFKERLVEETEIVAKSTNTVKNCKSGGGKLFNSFLKVCTMRMCWYHMMFSWNLKTLLLKLPIFC